MKMEQKVLRNVDMYNSDAGELPRRKPTAFRIEREFEIKEEIVINPKWIDEQQDMDTVTRIVGDTFPSGRIYTGCRYNLHLIPYNDGVGGGDRCSTVVKVLCYKSEVR